MYQFIGSYWVGPRAMLDRAHSFLYSCLHHVGQFLSDWTYYFVFILCLLVSTSHILYLIVYKNQSMIENHCRLIFERNMAKFLITPLVSPIMFLFDDQSLSCLCTNDFYSIFLCFDLGQNNLVEVGWTRT